MRRLRLIAIVHAKVLLVAEHVYLLEDFSLEMRESFIPYFEFEGLFVEQLELNDETLCKLLLSDVAETWLQSRVALFLLWQDFFLKDCNVVSLIFLVHLRKEKRIHEAFIQFLNIFGLQGFQKMQETVDKLR